MSEGIIIALISLAGLIIVEVLRRGYNNKKSKELETERKHQELVEEIKELRRQVEELQDEVIEWQEKYLNLLRELAKKVE